MNKIFSVILILFLSVNFFGLESLSLNTFFNNDELKLIDEGQLISRMFVKFNINNENSHDFIVVPQTKYCPENFSKYEAITDEKGFIPYILTDESKLNFYNILVSFSKLEGMEYYSRRAGKVETLILKCYKVESLSGSKHNDKKYDKILPKTSNMFLQKDNKFGTLTFRSDLYNEGDNFIQVNTCIEPISKLFININDPEEYKIVSYFIYDKNKGGYYYYVFQGMRVKIDLVLKNGTVSPTTFSNRLRASTVQLAKMLGLNWKDKLNPWPGKYDTY